MNSRNRAKWLPWMIAALAVLAVPGLGRAGDTVGSGWDLFRTEPVTLFNFPCPSPLPPTPVNFEGNPLRVFDFGPGVGVRDVGETDTIVRRREAATVGGETIDIEIVALSLRSVGPVQICGGPAQEIFVELDTDLGDSTMTINGLDSEGEPHGTFDSTLHFRFDVKDSAGNLITTVEKTFKSENQDWGHRPESATLLLDGINHLLNGQNEDADFFPVGLVIEDDGQGNRHVVRPTPSSGKVPALAGWGTVVLVGFLLLALAWGLRRRVGVAGAR